MQRYIFFIVSFYFLSVKVLAQATIPADKTPTKETINLYNNLFKLTDKGFMFGHQDDLAYGVNWRYEKGRSDVKEAAGDYPAVYGWELGGIELGHAKNLDEVPFDKMKQFIRQAYGRGAVITISWHVSSPFGYKKGAWDTTHGTVASVLPGGSNHQLFKGWLNHIANFIGSLKGKRGEPIPVLFRPFHELTGNWFWWGKNSCTASDFKDLWRFSFQYLHNEKKLHNLLWVYNTSDNFNTREGFLERYPGDDVTDILSFDSYQYGDSSESDVFTRNVHSSLSIINEIAKEKNKLTALAETGYEAVPYSAWWTQTLLKAIGNNKISYVLVWRNHGYQESTGRMHYYAPYKGQVSANDFAEFYKLKKTLFEKEINEQKLYR